MKKIVLLLFLFAFSNCSRDNDRNDQNVIQEVSSDKVLEANPSANDILSAQMKSVELFEIPNISIVDFILSLFFAAVLSFTLSFVYVKFGNSISNRKQFARNFVILTLTTMLIITVVKSSLALSLGLVGALSIIRFRTAIKEPEELVYLFLAISIGLGFGANQGIITVLALTVILSTVVLMKIFSSKYYENQNLYLTIVSLEPKEVTSKVIIDVVSFHCQNVHLRRIDETARMSHVPFCMQKTEFFCSQSGSLDLFFTA